MSELRLLLAGEDSGHYEAVVVLTDRVLEENVDWVRGIVLSCRRWLEDDSGQYLRLTRAFERARKARLRS